MKTKDFLKEHSACTKGAEWALSVSEEMADVWDAMIEQGKHKWLIWTVSRPGVFSESVLRKLACRFVRETPLHDGRTVWDLLTDERSRKAVEVAELSADGKATAQELETAYDAARAAAHADAYAARVTVRAAFAAAAARAAAYAEAYAAAYVAADAARDAACAAAARDATVAAEAAADDVAKAAQAQMIAELGNPFKERTY